jgi:cyclopropane fatty-acyl-phospholipid synthase-like methyltransferase
LVVIGAHGLRPLGAGDNMFEEKIAKNLRKPSGFYGRYIGRRLKGNLSEYYQLEKCIDFINSNSVLEIGFGPGYGIQYLCSRYSINIDGVDFSETMYKAAQKRNKKLITENRVKLYNSDFEKWEHSKNVYDIAYLINVIYFWNETKMNFEKIYDCLKSNGKIAIGMASPEQLRKNAVTQNSIFNKHDVNEIENMLKMVGFSALKTEKSTEDDGCYFIVGRKI